MSHGHSRRDLGRFAASAAVAAALRSFSAQAQMQAVPKRVVLFFTPHGTVWNQWRPTVNGSDYTLGPILQPLQSFKSRTVILDGVGLPAGGPGAPHTRGPAVLFTGSPLASDDTFKREDCAGGCSFGWNTSKSVDQEIATRLGNVSAYKSLEYGVVSGGGFPGSHISYAGPAQPLSARQDPYVAYTQLFGANEQSAAERAKTLRRRLNVMKTVQGDVTALKGRVSVDDARRLDAHATGLADIERALQFAGASCTQPMKPEQNRSREPNWAIDRQSELLAASLACGLTRVASLMFRPGENDGGTLGTYSWLNQTAEHHLTTHDTSQAAQDRLVAIYTWYASRFAYLLQKLDSYPEADGNGTLLDHTMVVWGSEIGVGNTHDISNVPWVIAGGGKAGVRTGRYMKVQPTMNHRLLVSMLHYMGFTDVTKFGLLDTGSGPLSGLLV